MMLRVGDKVVCIDDRLTPNTTAWYCKLGEIYSIDEIEKESHGTYLRLINSKGTTIVGAYYMERFVSIDMLSDFEKIFYAV